MDILKRLEGWRTETMSGHDAITITPGTNALPVRVLGSDALGVWLNPKGMLGRRAESAVLPIVWSDADKKWEATTVDPDIAPEPGKRLPRRSALAIVVDALMQK